MDINYILRREQISLYNASVATSAPVRIAHEGLAKEYGRLLEGGPFPHRRPLSLRFSAVSSDDGLEHEGEAAVAE